MLMQQNQRHLLPNHQTEGLLACQYDHGQSYPWPPSASWWRGDDAVQFARVPRQIHAAIALEPRLQLHSALQMLRALPIHQGQIPRDWRRYRLHSRQEMNSHGVQAAHEPSCPGLLLFAGTSGPFGIGAQQRQHVPGFELEIQHQYWSHARRHPRLQFRQHQERLHLSNLRRS